MFRTITLVLCLAAVIPAQRGFRPLRVTVDKDGLYLLSYAQIAAHMDVRSVSPNSLTLVQDGVQVPIEIRGGRDGRLDPGDGIVFFGRGGRGPHSKDGVYILERARNPRRIGQLPPVPLAREVTDTARRILVLEEDKLFAPLACVRKDVIRSERQRSHWYWHQALAPSSTTPAAGTSATCVSAIQPEPRRSEAADLIIDVVGPTVPGIKQKVIVNVNGRDLPPFEWDTPLEKQIRIRIPSGIVERRNSIQVRNLSPVDIYDEPGNEVGRSRNRILIDRMTLEFGTLLMGPSAVNEQIHYRINRARLPAGQPLQFEALRAERLLVYDVGRHCWATAGRVAPPRRGTGPLEYICAGVDSFREPESVAPLRPTTAHMPGPGADWVVVTTSRLAPLLGPLVEHRRSRGFTPAVVEAGELYDTFTHGRFDPRAISRFVRAAHRNWKLKPKYLLLVGDADHGADWLSTKETIPTQMVMTDYNGATATDALYGDVDGDGMPDISVGRLPVRTPDGTLRVVNRIIDLETKPPAGTWRRRIRFVAGQARFSPIIDRLLERTFKSVVAKEIPAAFRLSMTWSNPRSPFYWPASRFSERVVSEFNGGSLVFTYVGHGSAQAFDVIRDSSGFKWPILDAESVASIDAGSRNPILAIIACWTGMFDAPARDCIGELLLRKDGGPAAIIASSRISHPYPDALIGLGLARALFKGRRPIGDVLRDARVTMMSEATGAIAKMASPFLSDAVDPQALVKDHIYLYNLLGDPATSVPFPERDLTVVAPKTSNAGTPMNVEVACGEAAGRLMITVDRPVTHPAPGLEQPDPAKGAVDSLVIRNHLKANNPTVARGEVDVKGGNVIISIDLPEDLPPGKYHVTAYLVGAATGGDGLGSTTVTIGPKDG